MTIVHKKGEVGGQALQQDHSQQSSRRPAGQFDDAAHAGPKLGVGQLGGQGQHRKQEEQGVMLGAVHNFDSRVRKGQE